jgi:adenylate kinase
VRLVLLGPPGAGKGTQAARLSQRHGLAHISSGEIFRRNMSQGTELGVAAKAYVDAGELVPDDLTVRLVMDTIGRMPQDAQFVLDGFPRNIPQAEILERELEAAGRPLSGVVALALDEDLAVKRIAGRRTCADCQTVFNVEFDPPRAPGRCDRCGGTLLQRTDEDEDTVRRRLEVYRVSTAPLLGFYSARGLLREIDAAASEEQVAERIGEVLADTEGTRP